MPALAFHHSRPIQGAAEPLREDLVMLSLRHSPLRPPCPAKERIFKWIGVNSPPASTLSHPILVYLDDIVSRASLIDSTSYGAGLRKFHIFCDVFSVPESARLPASLPVLKSFALWAITDPDPQDFVLTDGTPFELISVVAVRRYLAAVRAWHLAQGWLPPLSEDDLTRLTWSLRGLDRLQANFRHRPPRPPITLDMLLALRWVYTPSLGNLPSLA